MWTLIAYRRTDSPRLYNSVAVMINAMGMLLLDHCACNQVIRFHRWNCCRYRHFKFVT